MRLLLTTGFACAAFVSAGCELGQSPMNYSASTIGDAKHGKQLIESYGCGACHTVPGVRDARGLVGPPLEFFAQRTMVAGQLPNTAENLTHWIQHPRLIEPKTAMPDLGVTAEDAYDIAAYLYTLRRREETSWTN